MESGGDLLSRAVTSQVPSALKGLTSVFGMEEGEPLTTAGGGNLVRGEVNRKGVSSTVWSHDL